MTENWCYGTMSVSAPCMGHYYHRGLWEMTLDVLLLILALTACLTAPVHCEEENGSGVPEIGAHSTEERTSVTVTHTPAVTNSTIKVHIQDEEVSGGAETHVQVTLEQTSMTKENLNVTRATAGNRTTEVKLKSVPKDFFSNTTVEQNDVHQKENHTEEDTREEETEQQFIIVAVCLTLALLAAAAAVAGLLITHKRRKNDTADSEKDDPYLDDEDGEKVPMPMFEDDMPSVMELEMEDFEKWIIKGGRDISTGSKENQPS